MNRLRNLDFRCTVMPFVLAALALRALIPAGFMPGSSETFGFTAMLCASVRRRNPRRDGTIRVAGQPRRASANALRILWRVADGSAAGDRGRVPSLAHDVARAGLVSCAGFDVRSRPGAQRPRPARLTFRGVAACPFPR